MNLTFIKYRERFLLLTLDLVAFFIAYCVTYKIRFSSGWFENQAYATMLKPALTTSLYWVLISALRGQYQPLYGLSRLDSIRNTIKTTTLGILVLYILLTLSDEPPISKGKITLLIYGALVILFAGGARVLLRTIQHQLILRGIAVSPALIVGFNERGRALLDQVLRYPTMGFKVAGYVDEETPQGEYRGIMILGKVEDLPKLITQNGILEILIALKKEQEELIEKVIEICGQCGLNIKIVPEMYQVIYGQVRTQSVYGMPLIEVFPQLMKPLERFLKRIMDIVVSMLILVISLPVSLVIMLVIKLESPGPIIYSQKRVGKEGKEFTIYKFRSMVQDAEKHTGAKWAEKNDPRVTRIGGFLRRTHLDEIPQFFNVMIGNMSLVGPRPERKFFVEQFVKQIPLYSRRHNVKPGLTSFAQLQGIYDSSLETVKTRLSFDMQYINSMSFALDIKILWQTVFLMLKGTGR